MAKSATSIPAAPAAASVAAVVIAPGAGPDVAAAAAQALTAPAPAIAAPAGKARSKDKAKMAEGIFVKSIPPSFRRCAFSFDRDGMGIALDALTEEQLELLVNEPNLRVERIQFPLDEDA